MKISVITTIDDASLPLFLLINNKNVFIDFILLNENIKTIISKIKKNNPDYIYIRDPFNSTLDVNSSIKKLEYIMDNFNWQYIDNISGIDDFLFEDKFIQYKKYSKFMPKTMLLSQYNNNYKNYIVKKRISSKAKWIFFDINEIDWNKDDYIIQERIKAEKEYRIYVLKNYIIPVWLIKTTKTSTTKVLVKDKTDIPFELNKFIKDIIKWNKFDLIWLDIIYSGNKYYLLEINRSPQFKKFFKLTSINLAEELINSYLN